MISAALMLFANTLYFLCGWTAAGPFPGPFPPVRKGCGWNVWLRGTRMPGMSSLSGIFALWHIL